MKLGRYGGGKSLEGMWEGKIGPRYIIRKLFQFSVPFIFKAMEF